MEDMSDARAGAGAGRLGDELFAIGGEQYQVCNGSTNNPDQIITDFIVDPVDQIEKYDTVFNFWEDEDDDLPADLFRFSVVNLNEGGGMFIFGGQGNFIIVNEETREGYYPVKNKAYSYVPTSIYDDSRFTAAEITGIIISAVIIALILILAPCIVSKMIKVDDSQGGKRQNSNDIKRYLIDEANGTINEVISDLHPANINDIKIEKEIGSSKVRVSSVDRSSGHTSASFITTEL